jgi:hypothetical protein
MTKPADPRFVIEEMVVQKLCETIGTARALSVSMLLKHREYEQLLALRTDPSNYETAGDFADDYLVTEVLRKSPNIPLEGVNRRDNAVLAFLAGNRGCAETNERLISDSSRPEWFDRFREKVAKIVGPLTTDVFERILGYAHHGPGATVGVPGVGTTASEKYRRPLTLTQGLMPFICAIFPEPVLRNYRSFGAHRIVDGSEFFTVPKDAETYRGACKEPTANVYMQLGIGEFLMDRLRRFGCNLHDQTRNQKLAERAWEDGLATIDLKNASNSISWSAIMEALPLNWFHLLDLARCPVTSVGGDAVELEMFSSMGNGYTFPLESLIFLAVCEAVVPVSEHGNVSVYGDDIIVPQAHALNVVAALNYLGFSVNDKKSFLAGNFFESCGTDWFKGQNVRPFYLRRTGESLQPYVVEIANALRLYAARRSVSGYCDSRFKPLWDMLRGMAPRDWRISLVPPDFGHAGFIADKAEARTRNVKSLPTHGSDTDRKIAAFAAYAYEEGWAFACVLTTPVYKEYGDEPFLLVALANAGRTETPTRGREPVRGYLGRLRRGIGSTRSWPDLTWL